MKIILLQIRIVDIRIVDIWLLKTLVYARWHVLCSYSLRRIIFIHTILLLLIMHLLLYLRILFLLILHKYFVSFIICCYWRIMLILLRSIRLINYLLTNTLGINLLQVVHWHLLHLLHSLMLSVMH